MAEAPEPTDVASPASPSAGATPAKAPRRLNGPWFALLAATILVGSLFALRPGSFFDIGINTYGTWFLDSYAILASNDAQALGIDVYKPNPLDVFHRPHVYSSWWLYLGRFGLTRADTLWVSLAMVGGFAAVTLALYRPRRYAEAAWYAVLFLSPPMLLAANRANNDLVVYVLLAALPAFVLSRSRIVRSAAPFLIAFATGLKYYPAAAALLLLAGRDRREASARVTIQALLFAVVGISIAGDLRRLPGLMPHTEGLMTFGATAIPSMLGWTLGPWTIGTILLGAALCALAWVRTKEWSVADANADGEADAVELGFVAGAALLCACFWLGMNHGYRWVFALWMAPWLWREGFEKGAAERGRRLVRATGVLLVCVLWADSLIAIGLNRFIGRVPVDTLMHWANRIYAVEQPMTWSFFTCLLFLIARYLRTRTALRPSPSTLRS